MAWYNRASSFSRCTRQRIYYLFYMYNIDQLKAMGDAQLRELAKSMGIKHVDSFDYDGLVFQVLDHQAETEAANAPEPTRRRRERIRQPAAKANGNEVIKDDAVAPKNQNKEQINIIDNTEADSKPTDVVVQEAKAEPKEQPKAQKKEKAKDKDKDKEKNEVQEPPKRKRGRPSAAEKAARDLLLKNEPVEQTATTEEALQQELKEQTHISLSLLIRWLMAKEEACLMVL